jgi:hypothetical protein
VIDHGFTLIAVMALLQYYGHLKRILRHNHLFKLVSFELTVFTDSIQTFVYSILVAEGVRRDNSSVTANDLTIGIPALLGMHSREYGVEKDAPAGYVSTVRAVMNATNPMDLVQGMGKGVVFLFCHSSRGDVGRYSSSMTAGGSK